MREETHRLDQLRDALDDLLVVQSLYVAARDLWEYASAQSEVRHHRNFEVLTAELVKRGMLLRDLREAALLSWLEGRPLDLSEIAYKGSIFD